MQIHVCQPLPETKPESSCSILVSNLPPDCDREVVELYFDSKKRSGGGGVQTVEMLPEYNEAIVTFKNAEGQ